VFKVYVVADDDTLESRPVQVGRQDPKRVEIVSGLAVGEQVLQRFADGESNQILTSSNDE
jgi:multidrug efflux pump subunit AcrA (membrane-fusion protein)